MLDDQKVHLYRKDMKAKMIVFSFLALQIILVNFCPRSKAQKQDTVFNKYSFALDLVPFYFDFFDNRVQARTGIDFEMNVTKRTFISFYWDMGLYDDYTFTKYYNFFNQGQGFYAVEQHTKVSGFHFIPGYNFYFWRSKVKQNQGMYAGGIIDLNYYRKLHDKYNSLTGESAFAKKHQFRTGAGVSIGGKYFFGSHFFAEIKTSFLAKIFVVASEQDVPVIRPINAQWADRKNNFWWVTNLNIGYAF